MPSDDRLRFARFSSVCLGIVSWAVAATSAVAQSNVSVPPGLYALTIQTVLPHFEVALRYATVTTNRCLANDSADIGWQEHDAFAEGVCVTRWSLPLNGRSGDVPPSLR